MEDDVDLDWTDVVDGSDDTIDESVVLDEQSDHQRTLLDSEFPEQRVDLDQEALEDGAEDVFPSQFESSDFSETEGEESFYEVASSDIHDDVPSEADSFEESFRSDVEGADLEASFVASNRVELQKVSIADMPIKLEMVIGVMEVRRSSLDLLGIGDVVVIGSDGNSKVSIVSNGKEIGSGGLIQLNDQLAVQITSVGM